MGRRTLFFIALAGLPVHAAILATWGAHNPGPLLSNLLEFAVGVVAGIATLAAARRSSRFARQVWYLVSAGLWIYTAGQGIVIYYDNIAHAALFTPWISDQFLFFWIVPLVLAALVDPLDSPRTFDAAFLLDLIQVVLVALAIHYLTFAIPAKWQAGGQQLAFMEWKVKMARDGVVLGALALRAYLTPYRQVRALFLRLSVFFLMYAVADAIFLYAEARWMVRAGTWMDLLWTAPRIALILIAVTWRSDHEEEFGFLHLQQKRRRILLEIVPVAGPVLVLIAVASLIPQAPLLPLLWILTSLLCTSARVLLSQRRQEQATQALRDSEFKYRELVENMAEIVFATDHQGRFTYLSPAVEQILGYKPEEMLGQDVLKHFLPADLPAGAVRKAEVLGGKAGGGEWRILSKTGAVRWLRSSSHPIFRNGKVIGASGIAMDITERKAFESRFLKAFHASPAAMTISRLEDGCYLDANERWLNLAGLKREQLLGNTSVELGLWAEQARAQYVAALKRDHSVRDMEVVMRLANGRQRTVLLSAELVEIEGEPCILAAVQDVTEVRKMEQQLRQKQKMEAIGTLAGGIAHDFNNLLTIIKGYSQLMEEKAQQDETLAAPLHHIGEAADRASSLIRQLLAFSRQQMLHPQVLKLNTSLVNIEKLLRRLIGEDIEFITGYAADLWSVKADPSQIEQVVMNLAVNARDAMPKGGKLIFETSNADVGEREQQQHPVMKAGRYVLLTVTDTGTGMDSETQNRIFEPFFTTKAAGHGTGLGLATVYGIVKQSNGYIWVESEPGRGTAFQVYLPQSVSEAAKATASAPQEASSGCGSETILLVEDDGAVRKLAATVLTSRGYRVLEAGGVKEAEDLIQQVSGAFDLLLTDMVMPGASGHELAQRVRSRYPAVRVLFISGYSQGTHSWQGPLQPPEEILQKPFTPMSLAARVRQTLDAAPAPAAR